MLTYGQCGVECVTQRKLRTVIILIDERISIGGIAGEQSVAIVRISTCIQFQHVGEETVGGVLAEPHLSVQIVQTGIACQRFFRYKPLVF